MDKIELLGGACFSHGPYTFYKAVRISNSRVLRLGSFFLTKLWSDADLVSIGELQLLWIDSRGPNTPLASLRLYFLPENTPDGRRDTHGEDEVLTISEKVVVRVHDLVTWLSPSLEWSWGREVSYPPTPLSSPDSSPQPQVLSDPGLDFSDVERHQKDLETASTTTTRRGDATGTSQTKVVVLSYPRYCRYRALLRRLEGSEPSWLCSSIAAALGGFTAFPGTRILFCRDTFDYPDLETHELLCNHLAPKLKGRPRRKRKKRSVSPGESSNESEASVASSAAASTSKGSTSSSGQSSSNAVGRPPLSAVIRRSERKISAEEKKFVSDVQNFMTSRNTPLGKMPLLGYRQIDLFLFYTKVQDMGGYDRVSANRLWKSIYDEMGGNTGSTSAATITRRHYERLLLPYERCQKGEDSKVKPNLGGRRVKPPSISDVSEDSVEVKREAESPPPTIEASTFTTTTPPPLQSILSTSPFLPGEKPRSESGKTSSLRSVRVKPERLKSLNTMIATSNPSPASQQQLPSSPTSLHTSTTSSGSSATPLSAAFSPSGSPTATSMPLNPDHSVLERQLNSSFISQQVPPSSCSPPGLPVSTVATNATTVVTLTPPPEKDLKEIKLDPKQTNLLAQGKENIPLFEEKSAMYDKTIGAPRSPEVIDLETENESGTRDKLIIPSFKKRKLEILREGGLEVTPVELDSRPSVIQPTMTTTTTDGVTQAPPVSAINTSFSSAASTIVPGMLNTAEPSPPCNHTTQSEDSSSMPSSFNLTQSTVMPKLINVTVTPDIGHMLPHEDNNRQLPTTPVKQPVNSQNSNGPTTNQTSPASSRVINLDNNTNNATLLQLYANANINAPQSLVQNNQRFAPPQVSNGRLCLQPGVTQSKSMFDSSEKMVYGNPKDILVQPKYVPSVVTQPHTPRTPSVQTPSMRCGSNSNANNEPIPGAAVVDLSQKATPAIERASYGRPNLEIVKVPVVPRPTPLNLETRNHETRNLEPQYRGGVIGMTGNVNNSGKPPQQQQQMPETAPMPSRKNHFVTGSIASSPGAGYPNVLDSRTMATNNLEITLVSPRKTSGGAVGRPQLSPTNRNNHSTPATASQQRRPQPSPQQPTPQQQHHLNGKFSTRLPAEPVSPYTPRKPPTTSNNHHPVIPNVPNLSHLNANVASSYAKANQIGNYQQLAIEKRKPAAEAAANNEQQRRISEGDKVSLQQQQQQRLESKQQSRESELTPRRHSLSNVPTGYIPTIPPPRAAPNFFAHQIASNSNSSPPVLAAAAAAAAANSKFLPLIDPMYYSGFYNGLFPGPVPPQNALAAAAAAGHLMSPEMQAYYKDLFATSSAQQQQALLAMAASQQHQPTAPTSK